MDKHLRIFVLALFVIGLHTDVALAQNFNTNIDGLVLKELRCTGSNYGANIVNRTNNSIEGRVVIKVFDKDGDPVGVCSKHVSLGPNSGNRFYAGGCNCRYAKRLSITVQ